MTPYTDPVLRFWGKVRVPDPQTGCMEWLGPTTYKGYGVFYANGRTRSAHRFIWEAENGPKPDGVEFHHLCRNRRCVNQEHLRLMGRAEHRRLTSNMALVVWAKTHDNWQRQKTRCPAGHEYTPENTYMNRRRHRHCRACRRVVQ